jgi:hypothetical protein
MTLLFIDGFDHYTSSQMVEKGYITVSSGGISSSYARFEGQGWRGNNINHYFEKDIGVNKSTIYFGIAIKKVIDIAPQYSSNYPLLTIYDEARAMQIRIHLMPAFSLKVYDGASNVLGESSNSVFPDQRWCYLEVKIIISDTVGEVEIKVDEAQVLNLTSKDTKNGTDYIRYIRYRAINASQETWFDDFYIDDAQFHGDSRVLFFFPEENGSYSDFTPSAGSNYENVDEVTPDDDDTYNVGNDEGDKDSYGVDASGVSGIVRGVQVSNLLRKTGTLSVKTKELLKTGGSDFLGDEKTLSTDYHYGVKLWENNPDTSNPWTPSEVDAAEFGVEVTAMSTTTTT